MTFPEFRGEFFYEWAARSPDPTPLDSFYWEYLNEKAFQTKVIDLGRPTYNRNITTIPKRHLHSRKWLNLENHDIIYE